MTTLRLLLVCTAGVGALVLAGCENKAEDASEPAAAEATTAAADDPIASAEAAAPASIAKAAAIVSMDADGSMTELRAGTNGWTCVPDSPNTPDADPMCMDANAMEWAMAWIGHETPAAEKPGIIYMLSGGSDSSNTDPYATGPSEGGSWITTGPHMMVVGSAAVLEGYKGGANPDTKAPFVMWEGTPYAHLMIPVS